MIEPRIKFLNEEIEPEWLALIQEAMHSNVSKNKFRKFLESEKRKRKEGKQVEQEKV